MTFEWLDGNPEELPEPPRRIRSSWVWIGLAAVVAVSVAVVAIVRTVSGGGKPAIVAAPTTAAHAPVTPSPSPRTSSSSLAPPGPAVTNLGHPLLGVTAAWNLFARGGNMVVRIEPARGRITTTPVPPLGSNGALNFLVGPTGVIVRPQDEVAGYFIPDGRAPQQLAGRLANGFSAYPGPTAFQVWFAESEGLTGTPPPVLYDLRTSRVIGTGPKAPTELGAPYASDGSGYLLYTGIGGVYDVRPSGVRRATTGSIIAVGATRWLARECDEQFRCTSVVIDQRTLARRVLGAGGNQANYLPGAVSPDGRYAAYLSDRGGGLEEIRIVDLATGSDADSGITPPDGAYGDSAFVWAPDSSRLIAIENHGSLVALDPRSNSTRSLGLRLPPLTQLALRPAP